MKGLVPLNERLRIHNPKTKNTRKDTLSLSDTNSMIQHLIKGKLIYRCFVRLFLDKYNKVLQLPFF